jgi:hypothetical protein
MRAFTKFKKNYLYELPEDIQTLIYKEAFKGTLKSISDMRESLDNYEKLIEYVKNNKFDAYRTRAIWSIMLCYKRDVEDPYYKYFIYYADKETDFLRLNKTKMIKYNSTYSSIKYLEFTIYPIEESVSTDSYKCVKKILEEYTDIFLSNYTDKYPNIKGIELCNDKLRIEYKDINVFRCYIDIYNNILETYNFTVCILNILNMYNNLYPAYNLEYMSDLDDLRVWFEFNAFFCGFSLNEAGDVIIPRFYSARYV